MFKTLLFAVLAVAVGIGESYYLPWPEDKFIFAMQAGSTCLIGAIVARVFR